jgi:hypothetical protein
VVATSDLRHFIGLPTRLATPTIVESNADNDQGDPKQIKGAIDIPAFQNINGQKSIFNFYGRLRTLEIGRKLQQRKYLHVEMGIPQRLAVFPP